MARPAEPEKKLALAERAVAILEREGLSLSAERLAAALGIKRPTLLYHFPTYGHLVEAALVALLGAQAAFVVSEVERHDHPIDRLYAQLRAVHAFHAGREARLVFLTQAIAATSGARVSEIVARGAEVFEAFRRAAADRVREGIASGIVHPCDPDALVTTVRALVDGLVLQRVMHGISLVPAHELVWAHLLAPLKAEPKEQRATPRAPSPVAPRKGEPHPPRAVGGPERPRRGAATAPPAKPRRARAPKTNAPPEKGPRR